MAAILSNVAAMLRNVAAILDNNQLCSYSNLVSVELNYVGLDCNNLIFGGGGGVLKADFFRKSHSCGQIGLP